MWKLVIESVLYMLHSCNVGKAKLSHYGKIGIVSV